MNTDKAELTSGSGGYAGTDTVSLDELGLRYGTDKASNFHGYLRTYEHYMRRDRASVERVYEIGVFNGASLRMWRDYFPNAEIIGLDVEPKCKEHEDAGPAGRTSGRITVKIANAAIPMNWKDAAPADLIVDDGSHRSRDIITTFLVAWPTLKPGGLYIVEDLHAVYHQEYTRVADKSAAKFLAGLVDSELNTFGLPMTGNAGAAGTQSEIEYIHFYRSLAIVRKLP